MEINGTSSIVTGGASGIGEASARLLAAKGAKVVIADLNDEKGNALATEIGGAFCHVDVTSVDEVVAAALDTVAGADERVRVDVPDALPEVRADAALLERVVANLVENAESHGGGCVGVHVASAETGVTITVEDAGPGVPPDRRDRVFDRFARLDDARARDSGGSGLGLAIVRELVSRAGGTVGFVDGDPPFTLRAEIALDVAGR